MIWIIACWMLMNDKVAHEPPQKWRDAVQEHVRSYVETGNFAGCVLVAEGDEVVFQQAYGDAVREWNVHHTMESVFHLASVSKPFTSAAILKLVDQGKLDLHEPIQKVLPDYPHGDKLTVHHLLINSSGIPSINLMPEFKQLALQHQTPDTLVRVFRDKPLRFEPGSRYEYSNSNYNLLALIVERVSGVAFGEFVRRELLAPLGLTQVGHHHHMSQLIPFEAQGYETAGRTGLKKAAYLDWTAKTGNASIYASVPELFTWFRAYLAGKVISSGSRDLAFKAHLPYVGYAWFLTERHAERYIHFNGKSPGYCSALGYYPEHDLTVVVLSNIANALATHIAEEIGAIYFEQPYRKLQFDLAPLSQLKASEYAGHYQFGPRFYRPDYRMPVKVTDGHLFIQWDQPSALLHLGDDRFLDRAYWSLVVFERDGEGEIVGLDYGPHSGRRVGSK